MAKLSIHLIFDQSNVTKIPHRVNHKQYWYSTMVFILVFRREHTVQTFQVRQFHFSAFQQRKNTVNIATFSKNTLNIDFWFVTDILNKG